MHSTKHIVDLSEEETTLADQVPVPVPWEGGEEAQGGEGEEDQAGEGGAGGR